MPRRRTRQAQQDDVLVHQVAAVLDTWKTSPFEFEAACRTGLRSAWCLSGWSWHRADERAHDVVERALRRNGVHRPSWQEGQPEWTQAGVTRDDRTRCARCGGEMEPSLSANTRLYCSAVCRNAAHFDRMDADKLRDEKAKQATRKKAWLKAWQAKQPEQACEWCGSSFKPLAPHQKRKYCCHRCALRAKSAERRKAG